MPGGVDHTMSVPAPITVRVSVAASYDVVVGRGVLASVGERVRAVVPQANRVMVVYDGACSPEMHQVRERLHVSGFLVAVAPIAALEEYKTSETADALLRDAARTKLERSDVILALGGGITGDIAGFVAATYRRGIAWVQCPTTLLSMVDASVGGKTGVNLQVDDELQKNMVGAFHQPSLVLADVATLATLPTREFSCGCAEIIKHAMIARSVPKPDPSLTLEMLQRTLPTVRNDGAAISQLIASNVALKAAVVEGDEREMQHGGGRALLNLGHTFGHAMETLLGLQLEGFDTDDVGIQHGEAVGLGLIAATRAAQVMGFVQSSYVDEVRATLRAAGLPTRVVGIPARLDERMYDVNFMINRMQADKKTIAGSLRVILPTGFGTANVVKNPPREALEAGWREIGC